MTYNELFKKLQYEYLQAFEDFSAVDGGLPENDALEQIKNDPSYYTHMDKFQRTVGTYFELINLMRHQNLHPNDEVQHMS